jgi:ATP-binding cassette, subfamily F, member 3
VLLLKANLLLLDEPTNHLDLFAKEVLLQALQKYEGTMLFVSHDHAFLQQLATRIWHLTPEGIIDYQGTYEEYLQDIRPPEPEKSKGSSRKKERPVVDVRPEQDEKRKKIAALEKTIVRQEKQIADLNNLFYELQYGTHEYKKATEKLKESKGQLAVLTKEWEELIAQI